jgi:hypothetical protein
MIYHPLNNPRTEDGDFGPWRCDACGSSSPAFVVLSIRNEDMIICKGCLLDGIEIINQTILKDAVEKGKRRLEEKK